MPHLGPRNPVSHTTFLHPDLRSSIMGTSLGDPSSLIDPSCFEDPNPIPPDDFLGTVTVPLPPQMDDETAESHLPITSQAVPTEPSLSKVLNLSSPVNHFKVTDPGRERWLVDNVPTSIRLKLDTPFGKENLNQSFMLEPSVYHTLLPVFKSGYLTPDSRRSLCVASTTFRTFFQVIHQYGSIDFRPLRDPMPEWSPQVKLERTNMMTAAMLHYNGRVADVVRFIGGEHVSAHRDVPATMARLRGIVDEDVLDDLERIFTIGVPAFVNAYSTQENLRQQVQYGNHKSVTENPAVITKTLNKECSRQYVLHVDRQIWQFILNLHVCPMGLVNPNHPYKNPRITFDASYRDQIWSETVNDWTSTATEPEIIFGGSLMRFFVNIWNLRISFPTKEIYPGDDDFDGAFRRNKYAPDVVSLHGFMIEDCLYFASGSTFGGNTSPSNFEPVARTRQQLAQYLWSQPDTLERARPHLPTLTFSPEPTLAEIATFVPATADALNPGVLRPDGSRRPPGYDHHVDDNLYADIRDTFIKTVAASILALYCVLGFPCSGIRDPLSREKFNPEYTFHRPSVGITTNTRTLIISITDIKRTQSLAELYPWLSIQDFSLPELASLHGLLGSLSRWCRWARPLFFAIQNEIRRILRVKFAALSAIYARSGRDISKFKDLPKHLEKRTASLIASAQAKLLWNSRCRYQMTPAIAAEVKRIYDYLSDFSLPWEINIGHFIPRIENSDSHGDASWEGSGAFSITLFYWYTLRWSPETLRRIHLHAKHPDYIHINCLEFLTVLLQLAALMTRLDNPRYSSRLPAIPLHKCWTDNIPSKSWANKVSSTSIGGQRLVGLLGQMLARTQAGFITDFIAGERNVTADFISRPITYFPDSQTNFPQQIYHENGMLTPLDFFHPSPTFLSLLSSTLYSNVWLDPTPLPRTLGRFDPAESIISNSLSL